MLFCDAEKTLIAIRRAMYPAGLFPQRRYANFGTEVHMFSHVRWPHKRDPRRSAIYALNDVEVKAPSEIVWKLLIDAHNWPKFYPHAQDVKIVSGERVLGMHSKYTWKTANIPLVNTVQEFVPGVRLAWDSFLAEGHEDSSAYHGWVITPTDGGCHVLTEETQQGSFFVEELGRTPRNAVPVPPGLGRDPRAHSRKRSRQVNSRAWSQESLELRPNSTAPMSTAEVDKVLATFRGIGLGDPDLAAEHIDPTKYIEHNPRCADGVDGFRQYGPCVFTHGEGLLLGHNIFFNIFRFEDGLIVEHWAFFAKAAPVNESGHTQTDGPTLAKLREDKQNNKAIVRKYYETIHISGEHSKIPLYFSGDDCIRHEPAVRDGVTAFKRDLEELTKHRSIDKIEFLFGQGDFVFIAAKGSHRATHASTSTCTELKARRSLSAGGFPEEIPPREICNNNNGIL